MAKPTREQLAAVFQPHLQPGETVKAVSFGVKQPPMLLIFALMLLAILPGVIAVALLTKNYLVALTDRRLVILKVKGFSNHTVQEVLEYSLAELPSLPTKTSTGSIFTHVSIDDPARKFVAKFHRAYSPTNREDAMAIAAAVSGGMPA